MNNGFTQRGLRLPFGLRRWVLAGVVSSFVALSACGGGGSAVDRGPTTVAVDAKLNGLYWDKREERLYLTDDKANSIRAWDGDKSFPEQAKLTPAPASGATLGQLTRTADNTFYVTRFGFGTDGTLVAVPKGGAAVNLDGLDALRRRIGVTTAPDGALLDGWFIKGGSGSISEVTVSGAKASERELVDGIGKPVGVAAVGDALYVSDQNTGNVMAFSLSKVRAQPADVSQGKVLATFTTLDGIDLMTAAPDPHCSSVARVAASSRSRLRVRRRCWSAAGRRSWAWRTTSSTAVCLPRWQRRTGTARRACVSCR